MPPIGNFTSDTLWVASVVASYPYPERLQMSCDPNLTPGRCREYVWLSIVTVESEGMTTDVSSGYSIAAEATKDQTSGIRENH